MRQAGARVEVHADHFAPEAPDETWLTVVGQRGWVVVTKDKAIRYRGAELAALRAARVGAFVLTATGLTGPQNGAVLARAMRKMVRFVQGNRRPFIAVLNASGKITKLSPRRLRRR